MKDIKIQFLELIPNLNGEDFQVISKLFGFSCEKYSPDNVEELKEKIQDSSNYDVANAYFSLTDGYSDVILS